MIVRRFMMKAFKTILLFILIISLAIPLFVQWKIHILEKKVMDYLIEEKGSHEEQIDSLKGSFGKLPLVSVGVIFRDEPFIVYYYWEQNGRILQTGYSLTKEGYDQGYLPKDIKDYLHRE